WGFWIQRARFSSVFLRVPAAMNVRAPTLARLGPIIPVGALKALSAWHPTHPLDRNSFPPSVSAAATADGGAGGPRSGAAPGRGAPGAGAGGVGGVAFKLCM